MQVGKYKKVLRKLLCAFTRRNMSPNPVTILFVGSRFERMIEGISNNYGCCILNPKWNISYYLRYLKYGIRCYVSDEWVLKDFKDGPEVYNSAEKVAKAKENITKILLSENVCAVIVIEDMSSNNGLIVGVAKEMKIPTITYTDGVFIPKKDRLLGCRTDYFWVWGQYFKDKYIEFNLKEEDKMVVAGYPDEIVPTSVFKSNNDILFMGRGFVEWSYPERIEEHAVVARRIAEACATQGIQMIYRPHPAENLKVVKRRFKNCPNVKISQTANLYDDLRRYQYIVGSFSTAMVEAVMANNVVIHIIWEQDDDENQKYYLDGHRFDLEECIRLIESGEYKEILSGRCDSYFVKVREDYIPFIENELSKLL